MTKPSFTTDELRDLMKTGKWEDGYDVIVGDFLTWVDRTVPVEPSVTRLPVAGSQMAPAADAVERLLSVMRRNGMETMLCSVDGYRISVTLENRQAESAGKQRLWPHPNAWDDGPQASYDVVDVAAPNKICAVCGKPWIGIPHECAENRE